MFGKNVIHSAECVIKPKILLKKVSFGSPIACTVSVFVVCFCFESGTWNLEPGTVLPKAQSPKLKTQNSKLKAQSSKLKAQSSKLK
ncbi:MAG: hypothetical protein ACOC4H_01540, partial [bacterium]